MDDRARSRGPRGLRRLGRIDRGSNPPAPTPDTGTLLVSITDADGDFVSYSVDVLSVTLQRRGGGTVEVLPAATRIDFAQLTELSDLLSVATLAPGDIVGGKIRLDYGNAEVFVESGGQVVRANVVGANGAPLGVTELDIELAARNHLVITRGRAALLALDFDLAASHEVDLAQSPPVVNSATLYRRGNRARRRERAAPARRARLHGRRRQLVYRRRSPLVPPGRRPRPRHRAHDAARRRSRSTACRPPAPPASRRSPRNRPAR